MCICVGISAYGNAWAPWIYGTTFANGNLWGPWGSGSWGYLGLPLGVFGTTAANKVSEARLISRIVIAFLVSKELTFETPH